MNLVYTARFAEAATRLPKEARAKLPKALKLLAEDHCHPGLQSKRIHGTGDQAICEARLDQAIRFTFQIEGNVLFLRNVDLHDACLDKP